MSRKETLESDNSHNAQPGVVGARICVFVHILNVAKRNIILFHYQRALQSTQHMLFNCYEVFNRYEQDLVDLISRFGVLVRTLVCSTFRE